jgi:hypothetical protein
MLLRNYDNIMTARQTIITKPGYISTDTEKFEDGHLNVTSIYGSKNALYSSSSSWGFLPLQCFMETPMDSFTGMLSGGGTSLICGGGDGPVSYDDSKLSSPFSSSEMSYTVGSAKVEKEYKDGTWTSTYTRVVTALGGERTIREIGAVTQYYTSNNTVSYCLAYRKVLENEIVVPENGSVVLTFTTTVSANPNKPIEHNASATLVE